MGVTINPSQASGSTRADGWPLLLHRAGWCADGAGAGGRVPRSPGWARPRLPSFSSCSKAPRVLDGVHLTPRSPAPVPPALGSLPGAAHLEWASPMCCAGNVSILERFQHLQKKPHILYLPPLTPPPRTPTALGGLIQAMNLLPISICQKREENFLNEGTAGTKDRGPTVAGILGCVHSLVLQS